MDAAAVHLLVVLFVYGLSFQLESAARVVVPAMQFAHRYLRWNVYSLEHIDMRQHKWPLFQVFALYRIGCCSKKAQEVEVTFILLLGNGFTEVHGARAERSLESVCPRIDARALYRLIALRQR